MDTGKLKKQEGNNTEMAFTYVVQKSLWAFAYNTYTHTAIFSVKNVGKTCQTLTKRSKYIYLFEFKVITGITTKLGCDIFL